MEYCNYTEDISIHADCSGEQKLCIACIIQAVKDIHLKTVAGLTIPSDTRNTLRRTAISWILSDAMYPFSFLWCLENIFPNSFDTLNISKIRQTLLKKALKCKRAFGQKHPHKKNLSLYIKQ